MLSAPLKAIADRHSLRFVDRTTDHHNGLYDLKPSFITAHSYGIKRKQGIVPLTQYIDQGNPFAHIYIGHDYILYECDVTKRAVHVGSMNHRCIGIEMNEMDGTYEISEKTQQIFNEICDVLRNHFGPLPIVSHRYCTGKDCPKGYPYFHEKTDYLELGPYVG